MGDFWLRFWSHVLLIVLSVLDVPLAVLSVLGMPLTVFSMLMGMPLTVLSVPPVRSARRPAICKCDGSMSVAVASRPVYVVIPGVPVSSVCGPRASRPVSAAGCPPRRAGRPVSSGPGKLCRVRPARAVRLQSSDSDTSPPQERADPRHGRQADGGGARPGAAASDGLPPAGAALLAAAADTAASTAQR